MNVTHIHKEHHNMNRVGWLRAAVLGANDGIVSISSLIVGVAAANAGHDNVMIAGLAGLVAGALSMAAGEYVSVSSQSDTEKADLEKESIELKHKPEFELDELMQILISRGLNPETAKQAAIQMTAYDALGAHAREEMGISKITSARPLQAALTSALTFAVAGGLPLLITFILSDNMVVVGVTLFSLFLLGILGALGAYTGGARIGRAVARILLWSAGAMALTAAVGHIFGVAA